VGRHKVFVGFTYQRFVFHTIDGTNLRHLPSVYFVQTLHPTSAQSIDQFGASDNSVSANLSQYTGIIAFGLTDRIDISMTIPFVRVSMSAGNSNLQQGFVTTDTSTNPPTISSSASNVSPGQSIHGSASGIGDLVFNMKGTVVNGEKSKLALGMEARFPTGDQYNLLGTGAYGVKPYIVFSRLGRVTPHVNLGYQWNDFSNLYINPCHFSGACASTDPGGPLPTLRLPDSLNYSAGVDIGLLKRLTFVGDFVGQHYFNAPKVTGLQALANARITGLPLPNPQNQPSVITFNQHQTVGVGTGSVNVDNLALGLKWNPAGRLILSANALIRLDSGSLRPDRFVPLIGVSYRF
jgi:hypothetical protein